MKITQGSSDTTLQRIGAIHAKSNPNNTSDRNAPPPASSLQSSSITPDETHTHNTGQPLHRQEDSYGYQRSKLSGECDVQQRASLACIDKNYENKGVCQPFFESYKAC